MVKTIILSRVNWKEDDMISLRSFAMENCASNFDSLLLKPFSEKSLEEYISVNTEVRSTTSAGHDCLKMFSCPTAGRKAKNLRILRLKGNIGPETLKFFILRLERSFYTKLEYCSLHITNVNFDVN